MFLCRGNRWAPALERWAREPSTDLAYSFEQPSYGWMLGRRDAVQGRILFISTYVFEVLPTPEYGIRVLRSDHSAASGCYC
jgi:hypothetical protein